jgi:uncharacterized membrane protein
MRYAQIKAGVVINIIVLKDASLISLFSKNFDSLVRVDNISPEPQIGWTYDSNTHQFAYAALPE